MTVLLEYIMMTALLEYINLFTIQVVEKWSGIAPALFTDV